jgi:hypothetical protein
MVTNTYIPVMIMKENSTFRVRLWPALIALLVFIPGVVAVSTPASAATRNVTLTCTGDQTIPANVGDEVTFTLAAPGCNLYALSNLGSTYISGGPYTSGYLGTPTLNASSNFHGSPDFIGQEFGSDAVKWWRMAQVGMANPPYTVTAQVQATNGTSALADGVVIAVLVDQSGGSFNPKIYRSTPSADPAADPAADQSNDSSAATPIETLSLAATSAGATCTGGDLSGVSGSWLVLPSADQCKPGPLVKAGSKLLGWSTSAAFPVAQAQAQVDKKWGAIDETIGGIRVIFIPAGMSTLVSGSNTLYPVWGN